MSRLAPRSWLYLGVFLTLVWAIPIAAVEPRTLTVEGRAEADGEGSGGARGRALKAAFLEVAVEVARGLIPMPLAEAEVELLREALAPVAPGLVLTYRIERAGRLQPMAEEPERMEYVVQVTTTLDAAELRRELDELAFLRSPTGRPSVILRVRGRGAPWTGAADVRLEPLDRALRGEFRTNDFIVVDPGVLPGTDPERRGLLELARAAGADVAIDVQVELRETAIGSRIVGVVAEVTALAIRVQDAFELARIRLDTPAYHTDPDEATMRALDSVKGPLARNLRVQLEENWRVLARERGPIRLILHGVTGFGQVTAVWDVLRAGRGVEGAELRALSPGRAEFILHDAPSAGVLQSRLAEADLPGFRLEPAAVAAGRLELMVRAPLGEGTRDDPIRP